MSEKTNVQQQDPAESRDRLRLAVLALLARHGAHDEGAQIDLVRRVLGVSYKLASRRVSGVGPWTADEVRVLAHHCGESPAAVWAHAVEPREGHAARLDVAGVDVACTIWPGARLRSTPSRPCLVAVAPVSSNVPWRARISDSVDVARERVHEISALVLGRPVKPEVRVAVVDDDLDTAEAIARNLMLADFFASAFDRAETVLAALPSQPFDAFVVDWLLGGTTSASLLEAIRASRPHASLVVLTGQIVSGGARGEDVAYAASRHRAHLLEKPARTLEIIASIRQGLAKGDRP